MVKWLIGFVIVITALSVFIQHQVKHITEVAPVSQFTGEVTVAEVSGESMSEEPLITQNAATLAVADAMGANRVPPVQESPIEGEILMQ